MKNKPVIKRSLIWVAALAGAFLLGGNELVAKIIQALTIAGGVVPPRM